MERKSCVVTCLTIVFMIVQSKPPTEQMLHRYLLQENAYNKLILPLTNKENGTIVRQLTVKLGMRLSQLLAVSEKNQILTSNLWLRHEWKDARLCWNPEDFGGIGMTYIPIEDLWRPDVTLYNNADGDFVVTLMAQASLYFDGTVVWEPPVIYKTYCPINVEFFPFDKQECFMKFGIWTYHGLLVDLQHVEAEHGIMVGDQMVIPKGVDLCDYNQNVEWDIINVTARRKVKFYPCCPEPYPDITFNITIRRRPLFYAINLIVPCVAISALTVLVFYLPSDSGEKITLSISILLALTVFILLLSDINPPTSLVIPLIGKYLLFTMIVVTMSIFLTVYILSIHFRSPATHDMSPWISRVFIDILPKVLCMQRPKMKQKATVKKVNGMESRDVLVEGTCNYIPSAESSPNYENLRRRTGQVKRIDLSRYPGEIRDCLKGVKFIAEHLKKDDEEKLVERDWSYVAMVMDRLFLFIFLTAVVSGTLGIFLNAPSLYDPREPMSREDFYCT